MCGWVHRIDVETIKKHPNNKMNWRTSYIGESYIT
jgi:hypothetical protein